MTLVRDVIQEEDAGVRSRTVEITRDGKKHVLVSLKFHLSILIIVHVVLVLNIVQFLKILQKRLNH
jgi:hypothetical protein